MSQNIRNAADSTFLNTGMALAKPPVVKKRITNRDLTMILGILVALIIAFTLWVRTPDLREAGNRGVHPHDLKTPFARFILKVSSDLLY